MGHQLSAVPATEPAIRFCINAFATEGGVEEYVSPDATDPTAKWSLYARTPDNGVPEGVDLPWEGDYPSYEAARAAAERGCAALGLDPADIRLY